jgi:single-stranded DNA-specific DHH superfamily exonuclease
MSRPTASLRRFDVCNGDADGLCAALQWGLHDPAPARLITGLKREIDLLRRVPVDQADEVLVCDLSIARNREPLQRLLDAGVRVRYFDHHHADHVPMHAKFEAHLDADAEVCTSLLMDRYLRGRFHGWALVGAYGDALTAVAHRRAAAAGIDEAGRLALRRLGEAINYNAYGDEPSDVRIAPAALFRIMCRYADPLQMIEAEPIVDELDAQRRDDLARAQAVAPALQTERARLVVLPDAPWSRRVIGCLANELAAAAPRQAQAVLKPQARGGYLVCARAPRAAPHGADLLCAAFGGGGRAAAAGIDVLPSDALERFVAAFGAMRWEAPKGRAEPAGGGAC